MPYNTDAVRVVRGRFRFVGLPDLDGVDLAECNFTDQLPAGKVWFETGDPVWWSGECSGSQFDTFVDLLEHTEGDADLVVCWEGGDSYTGIRVKDGTVTRHKVVMTLGEPE